MNMHAMLSRLALHEKMLIESQRDDGITQKKKSMIAVHHEEAIADMKILDE